MKLRLLMIIVVLGLQTNTWGQSAAKADKKPKDATGRNVETENKKAQFKFLTPDDTHDYGTIPEGPKAVYEFQFINMGTVPLIITNAQASCGCTTPEYPKQPILPGKKGKIKVTYNTEGHPGNFIKSVYITSNAISNSNFLGKDYYELKIKGIVRPKTK